MRPNRPQLALPLLLLAALAGPATADDPPEWRNRNEKAPAAEWDALEGQAAPTLASLADWQHTEPIDWDALRGNVVLLAFWEERDRGAARDLKHLVELSEAHKGDGLVVLALRRPGPSDGPLEQLLLKQFLPILVAHDQDDRLARALSVARTPAYHLVGRDGRVRVAGVSRRGGDDESLVLDHVVEAVLAEPYEGERKEVAAVVPLAEVLAEQNRPIAGERIKQEKEDRIPPRLDEDGWPLVIEKRLFAENDFRGKPAPPIEVEHWLGPQPDLAGKCVLVYLFTTSDGPAMLYLPKLERMRTKFGDDLVVLALSPQAPDVMSTSGRPWADTVEQFFAKFPDYRFFKALDGRQRLIKALGARGLPHALVISSDGIVRWQGYPLEATDPLSKPLVGAVLEADAKRKEKERAQREDGGEGDGGR